ncbi:MAG TPA: aldo/keto reductase [Lichenihabitans sp.]|nr:aldo/keto reductase [Lichenihabitans sp.]
MDHKQLGRSGIAVAPWCFGGNVFGWTADEATSFRLLDAFVEAGFGFIDTADVYSKWVPGHVGGESEAVIGRWMKARRNRDRLVIATKVGMMREAGQDNLAKAHIVDSVDASLKRLQTDHIDLYQSHQDDPSRPVEEPLDVYAGLIEAGKVRAIGASNFSAERFAEALDASASSGLPRYETLQPEYNLYAREGFEGALQKACLDHGVGVIPYFSLAGGFLTGKYRSEKDFGKSARGGGMSRYLNDRGLRILAGLDAVAARHGVEPAQVALAWLAAQPGIAAPIASATSIEQLQSLVAAARLRLPADDLAELDRASAP